MSRILVIGIGIALIAVAWHDHRTREIPLFVTVPMTLVAWLVRGFASGWPGLEHAMLAWAVGAAVFLWPTLRQGMGGGDLLLMGALASVLGGWIPTLHLTALVLFAGAIVAGGAWIYHRMRGGDMTFPYGWAFLGGWWSYWLLQWGGGLHV